MKIIDEFKQFAIRGNVVDMAVGIIIGAAFGKIVDSLVKDVMMPPLGFIMGGIDFSNQELLIRAAQGATPAVSIKYGLFLNSLLSFSIIALAVFMVVKGINALKRKEAAAPTVALLPGKEEVLLTEIRDLLRCK